MSELTTETIKALAAEAKKWCGRRTDDPKSWDVFCTTHEWWQLLDALERGDLLPRMKPEEVEAAVQAMAREFSWRYPNRDASPAHSMAAVAREAFTRYAVQQVSEDYCGSFAAQGIGALRASAAAAERERDLANRQYEGLRRIIDGASESMTHDDAVQELKVWRDDATALDRVKRERDAALARVRELEARVKAADRCEEIEQTAWDDLARANETIVHLAHRLATLEGKENRT